MKATDDAETSYIERYYYALETIAEKYGCPMGNWNSLSLALAKAHVPALKSIGKEIGVKRGRLKEWDGIQAAFLWYDVRSYLERHPDHTVSAACEYLAKQHFWKRMRAGTLKTNHSKFALQSHWTKGFIQLADKVGWQTFEECFTETFAIANRSDFMERDRISRRKDQPK